MDVDDVDFVPPSPIPESSQRLNPFSQSQHASRSSTDVSTSQQAAPRGRAPSIRQPLFTSTQLPGSSERLPPLPQLPNIDLDLNDEPVGASNTSDSRLNPDRLGSWLVRSPSVSRVEDAGTSTAQAEGADNSRDRPPSPDVISITEGDSDVEQVDSDSDIEVVQLDVAEDSNNESESEIMQIAGSPEELHVLGGERPATPTPDPTSPPATMDSQLQGATGVTEGLSGSYTRPIAAAPAGPLITASMPGALASTVQASGSHMYPVVSLIQMTSPRDFRSPKRKRVASPEPAAATTNKGDNCDEEEEGDSCPICFDQWTTSGNHRLCSLRCGHLFGQSCIEKWLRGQGGKCPHCNAKAKRQDIRVLYAKTIKALDTTERDRALQDLEKEREVRRRVEMEGAQLRLQFQTATKENNTLREELNRLKYQLKHSSGGSGLSQVMAGSSDSKSFVQSHLAGQFILDKTIKIWDAGQCRVMAYSPSMATLVVSSPSSSPLFPGYGVKKISSLDFKTSQYLTIHSKPIRDLAFHPAVEDGMLLSCGLDKKVKMTSLISNAVVQSFDTDTPAWSCVWNSQDSNYFYTGLCNGLVLEFDVRNTDGPVSELNTEGSRSPVASLQFLRSDLGSDFRPGGLLIGQMDKVSFFEWLPSNQRRLHLLPLEGTLTSLHIEEQTRHLLASYRPTAKHPTVRHCLCEMISQNISTDPTVVDNVCSCQVVHTFYGGRTQSVLSRSGILRHPGDGNRLLVCAGDETNNSAHIWDTGTGQLTQRLLTGGIVVDTCAFQVNNTTYLAALTDKLCKVYKWSG
ncbi:E3 ubiquitin-protein ligase RFWD3-like isoform X2 [Mya arenaria]|uniref:E3 ubiquitin-protein ligase RFWD3-like isoform X2 n=1 Tax=Mya arenaria TaxID=6604 RepID=UPI0022DF30CB|nr:E3 ubiquitin-protein ligase RFWD3-like isoform X2 [Mya arenaria]